MDGVRVSEGPELEADVFDIVVAGVVDLAPEDRVNRHETPLQEAPTLISSKFS